MPRSGFTAPGLLIFALLLFVGFAGAIPAAALQETSPAAGTPAAEPTAEPAQPIETAQPAAAAAATPAAPAASAAQAAAAQTDVVTLVFWYANSANADIIELYPLATDANFVASPADSAPVGTVDFPEDGSPPTVAVGDTTFETYPRPDGIIERWTWLDDFEGARPATLVMQLAGQGGAYQNYYGTGTFMSRDEGGAGGVLVIALRPPSPEAAAEEQAAAEAPAEEAVVEEAPAEQPAEPAAADAESGIVIEAETPPAEGVIEIESGT